MAGNETGKASPNWIGYLVLAVVVAGVVGAGGIFILQGGDDDEPTEHEVVFGDDPSSEAGAPTPVPGTGALDSTRAEVGAPAPNFGLINARDSNEVLQLASFAGKPVVLNFYASWCEKCKDEIPVLEQAYREVGPDNLIVLGVNYVEGPDAAVETVEQYGGTFPIVLDSSGEVSGRYRALGLPVSFFINADGTIVARRAGGVTEELMQEYLADIGVEWTPSGETALNID